MTTQRKTTVVAKLPIDRKNRRIVVPSDEEIAVKAKAARPEWDAAAADEGAKAFASKLKANMTAKELMTLWRGYINVSGHKRLAREALAVFAPKG